MNKDILFFPAGNGRWLCLNVFARTSLGLDSQAMMLIGELSDSNRDAVKEKYKETIFEIWEVERFSNTDGLLADPSGFLRPESKWQTAEKLNFDRLLQRLKDHCIVVEDAAAYRARFAPKSSLMDKEHFGDFHQRLGQKLMLELRQNPETWWVQQKFEPDFSQPKNNLYRAVQYWFLKKYLAKRIPAGTSVVDVGCGVGFYSRLLGQNGAKVLGVDPNPDYIAMAQRNAPTGCRFEVAQPGKRGGLDSIPSESADIVFISDVLLFYASPISANQTADPTALLADIRRILKKNGTLISLEPHYIFWLLPWLGAEDRPFTVLTEYHRKTFGVTPTMSQFLQTFNRNGFAVSWMEELWPDPEFEAVDRRAFHFANQFPLWHLLELKPMKD